MQENTRVYHSIEGLKPELQMEDLKVKPKPLHWTDWTGKEFDALIDADVLDISDITVTVITNQENTTGLPITGKISVRERISTHDT